MPARRPGDARLPPDDALDTASLDPRRLDAFYDAVWVLCQAQAARMPRSERERFLAEQRAMIEHFRAAGAG